MATTRLAVLARPPVPGEVKTRLCPAVPPRLAAELHAAMLQDALETAVRADAGQRVLYWAPAGAEALPVAVPPGFEIRDQVGSDLGARLAAVFAELLASARDRAVVIGTDCPDLDAATIHDAFAALERHDLVLGPARDGGYYLIGLRATAPRLFADVAWGTGRVLEQTRARAAQAGLSTVSLPEHEDVDTPADLVRLVARRSVADPASGQRIEEALRAAGLLPPRS